MENFLVSVIIPFKDNHEEVAQIVDRVLAQDYPKDKIEIICIDNGSNSPGFFSKTVSAKIILLKEEKYKQSPYSARNRGVEASKGDILIFLDANSTIKNTDWIRNGLVCLENQKADIAAGKVSFDFGGNINAAGITDALTSIKMKQAVKERNVAYTANLFVKRHLFEKIGLFEEGVRSGGDVRWTSKAVKHGYKLVYCSNTEVFKKARSLKAFYKKKIRTGRGYYYSWLDESERVPWYFNFLRSLKPPALNIEKIYPERYRPEFGKKKPFVWIHLYLGGIIEQIAFLTEYFRKKINKNR